MKTNKRDKGIKGKPNQDINTCNIFYTIIRYRSYSYTLNQIPTQIYIGKSYKKAYYYMKLDKKEQLKTCDESMLKYRGTKIIIEESKKGTTIKTFNCSNITNEKDLKEPLEKDLFNI